MDRTSESVIRALGKLAALRQAEVSGNTLALYAAELATLQIPADVVVAACARIQLTQRHEGETAYPPLALIVDECRVIQTYRRAQAEDAQRKRLPPAPITPEQWTDIQQRFARALGRVSMRRGA